MRVALLRLLNRPSALHLLEDLISSPTRIQQLAPGPPGKCLYCQTHTLRNDSPSIDSPTPIDAPRRVPNRRITPKTSLKSKRVKKEYIQLPLGPNPDQDSSGDSKECIGGGLQTRQYPIDEYRDTASSTHALNEVEERGGPSLHSEDLAYESDVAGNESIEDSSVDVRVDQREFALWEELFRYRQRVTGDDGVLEIWKGLVSRKSDTKLPVEGHYADIFWGRFVDIGLRREKFLHELHEYARDRWKETGKRRKDFYKRVVGGFLEEGDQEKALKWHGLLKDVHLSHPNEIRHVFPQAASTESGLAAFQEICKDTPGHQIYGSILQTLYKAGRLQDAIEMHKFLVNQGDTPTRREDVEPLIEYFRHSRPKQEYEEFHSQLEAAGILPKKPEPLHEISWGFQDAPVPVSSPPPARVRRTAPALKSIEEPNQNQFQDSFGARLFATSSLAFEFILSGLRVFCVESIGPLSLREMALRAENAKDVSKKIDQLKETGISIGNSVFSRLVKKLAREGNERLLRDLLHSDQHPDVLEDYRIQESLLASYYLAGDWTQFDRTLTVLRMLPDAEDSGSFNLLFRNALNVGNRAAATRIIEQMREHNIHLTPTSREWMYKKLIGHRAKGKPPRKDAESQDDLSYLLSIWQHVVQAGGHIPPDAWREGLKRLGMTGRWDELQKLCLWLAHWYSSSRKTDETPIWKLGRKKPIPDLAQRNNDKRPPSHKDSPLRTIFTPTLVHALIAWGFKLRVSSDFKGDPYISPYSKTGRELIPWVRGIILVRQLRENGVIAQRQIVAKACRQRLAALYGEELVSSRPINRLLRKENPWTLDKVLADIESAWGGSLFNGNEASDRHRLVNPPRTKRRDGKNEEEEWETWETGE